MSARQELRAIARGGVVGATVCVLSLCASPSLWSQRPAPAGVALTEASFAQYAKSSDNLAAYIKTHPGTDMSATDKDYPSADAAAKELCEPHPEVRAAIAKGGLTCAQYFAFTVELEKAAAFASMFGAGQTPKTASALSIANLAFYRKHEAESKRVLVEIGVGDDLP